MPPKIIPTQSLEHMRAYFLICTKYVSNTNTRRMRTHMAKRSVIHLITFAASEIFKNDDMQNRNFHRDLR